MAILKYNWGTLLWQCIAQVEGEVNFHTLSQMLLDQCQKMEVDLVSLRDVLESERRESRGRREELELELAERKMSSHRLQEELQCLLGQLEEARGAQAALEVKCKDLEQQQRLEVEEKNLQISCLKAAEQELQSRHAVLVAENQQLKQDVDRLLVLSAENSAAVQKLQGEQALCSGEAGSRGPKDHWVAFCLALFL